MLLYVLATVAAGILIALAKPAIEFTSLHFLPASQPLRKYRRNHLQPAHAIVAGCVTGIGLGIAKELVKNGFGVFLLGNNSDELKAARQALESAAPGAQVVCVGIDPMTAIPVEIEDLVDVFKDLKANVSILVNDVGASPVPWPPLEQRGTESAAYDAIIDKKAQFAARLTAAMRPVLTQCRQRFEERSLILNITSDPLPGMPYSAMYGEAVMGVNLGYRIEFAKEPDGPRATDHIDYLVAHVPGYVASPMANSAGGIGTPKAEYLGKRTVLTVDAAMEQRSRAICPYWWHDLQWRFMSWMSEDVLRADEVKIVGMKRYAGSLYDEKTS